jgi:hypothetical protein
MLRCVDASGSHIIILVCIFFAASSTAAGNDFSTELSYEKGRIRESNH